MIDRAINVLVQELRTYIDTFDKSPFSYERSLLIGRKLFLDSFINGVPFPPFEVEIQMSSNCNLRCRWCIGCEVQAQKQVLNLPNTLNKKNIDRVIDGILDFQENGLSIEFVKFSGFIGEPLMKKQATLRGIQRLSGAGLGVGLFTNGVFMTDETWKTLSDIEYVHVSLDAGPSSFYWLKEDSRGASYTKATFNNVLKNISGLHRTRLGRYKKMQLNIGYVIVPGNHEEIYATTKLVKEAGADMIRFKCDIVGKHNLAQAGVLDTVFGQIADAERDFHDPPYFCVYSIHSRRDIEQKTYAKWKRRDGCYYQHFLAIVGSDGNLYLCDHNTMPGGISLGNVIDYSLKDIWNSKKRKYLTDGVEYTCQCGVCPPFGNRANIFLQRIMELCDQYGREAVLEAVATLRTQLG
jgi:radical SAM protein with 4Fe4S-binding SPASM domain